MTTMKMNRQKKSFWDEHEEVIEDDDNGNGENGNGNNEVLPWLALPSSATPSNRSARSFT